jgi:hypothetical protein
MSVKTYNPADVLLTVAGIPITGYADGTFIAIGRDNPSWNSGTGSDGEGWRAKSNDKSGTCTLTLLQTSAANDALSALVAVDEASGDGIGPLLLKDLSGRSLYEAETCWVEKPADAEFAREQSDREWVIKTDKLNVFVGGH